ncbi:MAG: type II secretion system F family protein [Nanoarchaeota archaeon]|nr:type II secretion system F family protein [Nanoarchaeota archaeon]MBU1501855.1 type II secretion system F family protein [Nanoarchaeota archaeon]MBU2458740.1 type II secretion system F family protein [Nanoarchaeota archaeon]
MARAYKAITIEELGQKIAREKKMISELGSLLEHIRMARSNEEKRMAYSQIESLTRLLRNTGQEAITIAEEIMLAKSLMPKSAPENSEEASKKKFQVLPVTPEVKAISPEDFRNSKTMSEQDQQMMNAGAQIPPSERVTYVKGEDFELTPMEKLTIKRMKNKDKKVEFKREREPSEYMKVSSKMFYNLSTSLLDRGMFHKLKRDLIRSNMEIVPKSYISAVFFSTFLAAIISVFIVVFFMFFSVSATPPFISFGEGGLLARLLKFFWIIIALPVVAFIFGYFYPSAERKSIERRINAELPFATIHMSAISSSMIEPSKLFEIIISTKEYPHIEKELTKLQNEINIYGYDLVTALRNRAFNSPSRKLSELFNGLATTITSGGNLPVFFDKRSQSLLFEHRLDIEKQSKASETFMDIYISVVIASPMILMLLLMMMRISGLGIALSPGMITVVIITAVVVINAIFLGFLQLRQTEQ